MILSWPQTCSDGRRRDFVPNQETKHVGYKKCQSEDTITKPSDLIVGDRSHQFLNTDYNDFVRFFGLPRHSRNTILSPGPTNSLPYGYETYIQNHESSLLSYCELYDHQLAVI